MSNLLLKVGLRKRW